MAINLLNFKKNSLHDINVKNDQITESKYDETISNIATLNIPSFDQDHVADLPSLLSKFTIDPISTTSYLPQDLALEEQFESIALQSVDTNAKINFEEFLIPNEGGPTCVQTHLDLVDEPGLIVSTGTERSFFDLALCKPEKCQGLIVRDINPRVKAYIDFNTMLLRISKDNFEYVELSDKIPHDQKNRAQAIDQRISIIKAKLEKSDVPEHVRNYYLDNLHDFGRIYFSIWQQWRKENRFVGVKYFEDRELFNRLQRYAKSGKIIATIGNINDLEFIVGKNIAIVDVSNIHDYVLIDLKGGENFHPRIIWTKPDCFDTKYYSYIHQPMNVSKRVEMNNLLDQLKKESGTPHCNIAKYWNYFYNYHQPIKTDTVTPFTDENLAFLKDFFKKKNQS